METLRAQGGGGTFAEAVHPPLGLVITALRGVVVGVTHLMQKDAQLPSHPAAPPPRSTLHWSLVAELLLWC